MWVYEGVGVCVGGTACDVLAEGRGVLEFFASLAEEVGAVFVQGSICHHSPFFCMQANIRLHCIIFIDHPHQFNGNAPNGSLITICCLSL
jgi:hypothetical protein